MREKLARIGKTVAFVASITLVGCERPSQTIPSRAVATPTLMAATLLRLPEATPQLIRSASEWQGLTVEERLKRLERKQHHPVFTGFDERRELSSIVSEIYCREIPCYKPPEQITQDVYFVSASRVADELEKDRDTVLTPHERSVVMGIVPVITTEKDRKVYLNNEAIEDRVRFFSTNPQIARILQGKDLRTLSYESLLLYGISKVNRSREVAAVSLVYSDDYFRTLTINRIDSLSLKGEFSDGAPYSLDEISDAMAAYAAAEVSRRIGRGDSYISFSPSLQGGADLVRMLNEKANIDFSEFAKCYTGQQSILEYIQKLGSLNQSGMLSNQAALLAMATIGLHTAGRIPPEIAKAQIESVFNQRLFER